VVETAFFPSEEEEAEDRGWEGDEEAEDEMVGKFDWR